MNKKLNGLVLFGLICFFIFGSSLISDIYRSFWGNKNIWWTPASMQLSLEESRNNFELLINGKLIRQHIKDSSLYAIDSEGKLYKLVSKDFGVRLNNWKKQQASILMKGLVSAFGTGAGLTCFFIGLWIQKRDKKKNASGHRL